MTAEALDHRHAAAAAMVFSHAAGPPPEVPLDGLVQQAHDCATQIVASGEEVPHAMGKRRHPVLDRDIGDGCFRDSNVSVSK